MTMNQTLSTVRKVVGPKSTSSLLLRDNLAHHPMGSSVMFSSVASLLGSPGQTNYSASNAVLDSLAQYQQASGLQWVSIQWGAWAEGGMASEQTRIAVERMGMGMVSPMEGMSAFNSLMFGSVCDRPVVSAVPFIWGTFLRKFGKVPAMFDDFSQYWSEEIQLDVTHDVVSAAALVPLRTKAKTRRPKGRSSKALAPAEVSVDFEPQVQDAVKSVLGKNVDREEPLMAAGLDSLGTVELKNALEAVCGAELPSTLVFDHPTVGALAAYLNASMASQADTAPESVYSDNSSPLGDLAPYDASPMVYISGLSSRMHAGFNSVQPADCSERVPLSRWDVELQTELCGGIPVGYGVFVKNVDLFDNRLFGLSETEAALIDPQ
jgi:acyl carrier protein